MEYVIDSELMIFTIQKRPILWDPNHNEHRERTKKRSAWIEVSETLFEDLDSKEEHEKIFISKQVELKWRHIRDNFTRYIKAKTIDKGKTKYKRKYIYADQLEFLRNIIEKKFENEEEEHSRERTNYNSVDDNDFNDNDYDSDEPIEKIIKKNRNKTDDFSLASSTNQALPFEESLVPMMENKPQKADSSGDDNDDMSFFKSLLPMLSTLTQQQKMKFRIDVMQGLMKYNCEADSSAKFEY